MKSSSIDGRDFLPSANVITNQLCTEFHKDVTTNHCPVDTRTRFHKILNQDSIYSLRDYDTGLRVWTGSCYRFSSKVIFIFISFSACCVGLSEQGATSADNWFCPLCP